MWVANNSALAVVVVLKNPHSIIFYLNADLLFTISVLHEDMTLCVLEKNVLVPNNDSILNICVVLPLLKPVTRIREVIHLR